MIDIGTKADALIQGLKKYFEKHNFQKGVVGISGGVDSAVTAAIASKALGNENVQGLILPHSKFSSVKNMRDAHEVADFLSIEKKEIQIDDFAKNFLNLPWTEEALTKANIYARVRMVILYSWANEHNALVFGTCNKSETLLGYETKFGDGACDVSILGSLWKTEVWEMANYFGFPEKFITKAPSAELMKDHSDEDELGYTYEYADTILQKWEKDERLDENDPKVRDILHRIKVNEHKRMHPPILSTD